MKSEYFHCKTVLEELTNQFISKSQFHKVYVNQIESDYSNMASCLENQLIVHLNSFQDHQRLTNQVETLQLVVSSIQESLPVKVTLHTQHTQTYLFVNML